MSSFEDNGLFGALSEFADLYGNDGKTVTENIVYIDVNLIASFKNHPFKVLDNEQMDDLVESIREYGVRTAVTVRKAPNGTYEMISGHRRLHAAIRAGLDKIPARVTELDDDLAQILVVDMNIQREEILASERAFAYKMRAEAVNRRRNSFAVTEEEHVPTVQEQMEEATGMSKRTIWRYIRLTNLIPKLLDRVDLKQIKVAIGEELASLPAPIQEYIYDYLEDGGLLRKERIADLRNMEELDQLTEDDVFDVLDGVYSKSEEDVTPEEELQEEKSEIEPATEETEKNLETADEASDSTDDGEVPVLETMPESVPEVQTVQDPPVPRSKGTRQVFLGQQQLDHYFGPDESEEDILRLILSLLDEWYNNKKKNKATKLLRELLS